MTSNEASRLIDWANVERRIKQAQFNRAQFIRNNVNVRYVIWTAGSIGAVFAIAVAGLSSSGIPRATPVAHHVSPHVSPHVLHHVSHVK
jgi:hypothetical protein